MKKQITAKEFLQKHFDIVERALMDYQGWYNKSEDYYKICGRALKDLEKLEDLQK